MGVVGSLVSFSSLLMWVLSSESGWLYAAFMGALHMAIAFGWFFYRLRQQSDGIDSIKEPPSGQIV